MDGGPARSCEAPEGIGSAMMIAGRFPRPTEWGEGQGEGRRGAHWMVAIAAAKPLTLTLSPQRGRGKADGASEGGHRFTSQLVVPSLLSFSAMPIPASSSRSRA